MRNSLVRQLIIRLLVVTGIALSATGALLVWQFQHASAVVVDRGLSRTLDEVARHLRLDPGGRPVAELPAELAARFHDELFFTLTDEHGRAYLSVPAGREHSYHPFETDLGDEPQYFEHTYLQGGESYLGVTQKIVLEKQEFWLQLVEEVSEWQNFLHFSIEVFLHGAGVLIVLHFLASAFLAYTTLRNSFRPVEEAALVASRIVPGRGDIRIGVSGLPAEVAPFARAINAALDRLESALAAQKRFTADAAHELLTPLAVIKADIEEMGNRAAAATLAEDVEEMTGIVTQLLELSELEFDPKMVDDIVDLRQIASDVLARMAPLAIRSGLNSRADRCRGAGPGHWLPEGAHDGGDEPGEERDPARGRRHEARGRGAAWGQAFGDRRWPGGAAGAPRADLRALLPGGRRQERPPGPRSRNRPTRRRGASRQGLGHRRARRPRGGLRARTSRLRRAQFPCGACGWAASHSPARRSASATCSPVIFSASTSRARTASGPQ